jgi:hypothetical protein
MKTVDELLAAVADQYTKQATRATMLYSSLSALDGYDMGGGCTLLVREGDVSVLNGRYVTPVARVFWQNKCEHDAATCRCAAAPTVDPTPTPPAPPTYLEQAFDDIQLYVQLEPYNNVQVGRETINLSGLITSWFKSQSFDRDDLDSALEYLLSYVAAIKGKIRVR